MCVLYHNLFEEGALHEKEALLEREKFENLRKEIQDLQKKIYLIQLTPKKQKEQKK